MIIIQIGVIHRELASGREIDEQWVNEQIIRRRRDGLTVCVRVTVQEGSVHITLNSAGCSGTVRGVSQFNANEQSVIDLWKKHRLDQPGFEGGNVIAFLKQIHRVIT